MKRTIVLLSLSLLMTGSALAEKTVDLTEAGKSRFEADFPSGGQLRMRVRSSELRVVGSDDDKIRVRYWGKNADRSNEVKISFKVSGTAAELRISGGPHNNFEIEVQVPRKIGLNLRVPAGEIEVAGLQGDKDIEVHAGDVTIGVGSPEDYAHVDASVNAGDLDADPFGTSKSGLFRSFRKQGAGKYHLHAHLGAGDLTLRP
jgi:hypothetical protein